MYSHQRKSKYYYIQYFYNNKITDKPVKNCRKLRITKLADMHLCYYVCYICMLGKVCLDNLLPEGGIRS